MMTLRRMTRFNNSIKTLIKFIRTRENSVFGVSDIHSIQLRTSLGLSFSNLSEHKFRYNFTDK